MRQQELEMVFLIDSVSKFFQNNPNRENTLPKEIKQDRRSAKKDRRQSVNDGVIVTLSFKKDRRSGRDRRRQ